MRLFSLKISSIWLSSTLISGLNWFEFSLVFDKKSVLFSRLVLLIRCSIFSFMNYYIDSDGAQNYFFYTVFLFVVSIMFLIYGGSLLSLILGWDGLGVVSYLLVVYYLRSSSSNRGAITFLSNRVGDVFFISCLVFTRSSFSLEVWNNWEFYLVGFLLLMCFITKRAQFPYSSWLPAAMAAPTPVSALVHSSTLVTAGVFLTIRFNLSLGHFLREILFIIGLLTSVYAGVMALRETDLKKVIALSTLRQLGFIFISLGLGLIWLAFFHIITHAIFKASLFFASGILIHNIGSAQDFRTSVGFLGSSPLLRFFGAMTTFRLIGFPFSVGFYRKDLILDLFSGKSFNLILQPLTRCVVFLTMVYIFRFCYLLFWAPNKPQSLIIGEENQSPNVVRINLFLGVLFLGGAFILLNFNNESLVIPSPGWKFSFLLLIFILPSLLLRIILTTNKMDLKRIFFSKIIYLNYFRSQVSQKSTQFVSWIFVNLVDKGWLEYVGAQGIYKSIIYVAKSANWILFWRIWSVFIPIFITSFLIYCLDSLSEKRDFEEVNKGFPSRYYQELNSFFTMKL